MMNKNVDLGLLLVRMGIGFPMLIYGINKLFTGIDFIKNLLTASGLPSFLGYGVYVGEIIAPILIIIGYRTSIAGAVLAINCFTAILLTQIPFLFKLNDYGGWALELLAIYMLIGLSLLFSGAGKLAISKLHTWD